MKEKYEGTVSSLRVPKVEWQLVIGDLHIDMPGIRPVPRFHRFMQRVILGFRWERVGDRP